MKKKVFILLLILLSSSDISAQQNGKKSIKEAMIEYAYQDIEKAIGYYRKLKRQESEKYNFENENELNNLGYQLMNEDRKEDALKIFKLLVEEFPNSFNPHDSLGEAYLINGQEELAIESYRKSLELNPENKNAKWTIAQIQYQNRDKNKFDSVYTKQEYLDDLNELATRLTEINPHPYRYMTKEAFWGVVQEKKDLITDTTTYSEFIWHCSELIANINCGHSFIPGYFGQEREMLPDTLRFPLELINIDKRLYVAHALVNEDKIEVGTEIYSINGISGREILNDINKHIGTQGKVGNAGKRHLFNWQATAMIPYALRFPKTYEVIIKGKKEPIQLEMLENYEFPLAALNRCQETFCLDFSQENNTAIMKINNWDFYGGRFKILQKFIDDSFQEIIERKSRNLIIDVRGNGGGNSWGAAHLLRYLAKKPFTYFKEAPLGSEKLKPLNPFENTYQGHVYFLHDGRSGSTTGQLLALAKHHRIGTLIGEESNGGIVYTGGQRMNRLTNTGVFYMVGRVNHITNAPSVSEERGVFPDHYVVQTLEDFLTHTDTIMNYVIKLIAQDLK